METKYYFATYNCYSYESGSTNLFNCVFEGSLYDELNRNKIEFNKEEYVLLFYKEIEKEEYQKLKDIL